MEARWRVKGGRGNLRKVGFKGTFGKTEIGGDVEKTVIQENKKIRKITNCNKKQTNLITLQNMLGVCVMMYLSFISSHACFLITALPTSPSINTTATKTSDSNIFC